MNEETYYGHSVCNTVPLKCVLSMQLEVQAAEVHEVHQELIMSRDIYRERFDAQLASGTYLFSYRVERL